MADSPTSDPIPDPTPAPAPTPTPAPTPAPAPTPTPGWKTSEAWISFIVIVLGAVPSSGLTDNAPTLAKIVGLVIAALSALNYTYQRSALKRAYVAAHAARASVPIVRSPQLAAAATILLVLLSVSGLCALSSCGAAASCQDPKNASSAECAIVDAAVDCTGVSSLPTAVTTVEPIVVKLLASAKQADGSINWAGIEGQLVDIALQYGPCVLANVWTNLMGSGAHAVEVAGAKLAPDDLKKEFDRIRARVAPGRTFNVGAGRKL